MFVPRRISTEFFECLFAVLQPRYRADINYVLEFDGVLDVARLDRALRSAIADQPIWAYRFVERWFYPVWQRSTADELRSLVTVVETDDVAAALHAELSQPTTASVRFTVIRRAAGDTVLVRTDHRLGDATSGRLLLGEVRRRYSENVPEPATDFSKPVVRRTARLFRPIVPLEHRRAILHEQIRRKKVEKSGLAFRINPTTEADPFSVPRILRYGPGSADELTACALRERGTPVFVLMATTYLALRDVVDLSPTHPVTLYFNVDLRRYLPQELHPVHAANAVGDVPVTCPPGDYESMSGLLAHIRKCVVQQRGPWYGFFHSAVLMDIPPMRWITRWIPFGLIRAIANQSLKNYRSTPRTVISDLGSLGRPDEKWGDVSLHGGYCTLGIMQIPCVFVGVSICNSQLSISLGCGPNSFVSRFVEAFDRHLCHFTGWPPGTARTEILQPSPSRSS